MALAKNKFLPEMSKEVRDIYDRLPSEEDFLTQERDRQQYYSLGEVRKALEKNRGREEAVYRTMADSLTRDKDAMRELLRDDPRVWQYIHPELRAEVDMKRTCLSSYNNHMKSININGDIALMYPSQLPTDVISDPRVILPAYQQAYQAQIQGQLPDGRPLSDIDPQGQRLEDRLMTMEMVLRAKGNPDMQQALNQVETNVLSNPDNVRAVIARAAENPQMLDAVRARTPEMEDMVYRKASEISRSFDAVSAGRTTLEQAGDAASGIEQNVRNEVTVGTVASATERNDILGDFDQNSVYEYDNQDTQYLGMSSEGLSREELDEKMREGRGDFLDPDGDGIRNYLDQNDYVPDGPQEIDSFSPFSSPQLLEAKDPADIFDNPWD